MIRVTKTLAAGILAGAVLVTGTARAQTATTVTTTSTTTSTSTTLLPHPFSPETRACVKDARQAFKQCAKTQAADCRKTFESAYAKCFAGTDGQKCATKCLTNEDKCVANVPTTKKSCRKTCRTNRKNDVKACKLIPIGDNIWAGGDAGCLTTARLTFTSCTFQCSGAKAVCHTNFTFCIADCPNQ